MHFNMINELKGFQLIQLIVTLAVIAILATISVPVLTQYQPSLKLNTDAKELINNLRLTQQMTITEQKVYYIEIDTINNEYSIIKAANPTPPIKTIELDSAINFQEVIDLTDDKVIFNSYGAVSESGQIILVNSENNIITINIKPSSYVQMEK